MCVGVCLYFLYDRGMRCKYTNHLVHNTSNQLFSLQFPEEKWSLPVGRVYTCENMVYFTDSVLSCTSWVEAETVRRSRKKVYVDLYCLGTLRRGVNRAGTHVWSSITAAVFVTTD